MSEDMVPYEQKTIELESHNGPVSVKLKKVNGILIPHGSFIDNDGLYERLCKVVTDDTISLLRKIVQTNKIEYKAQSIFGLNFGKQSGEGLTIDQLQQRFEEGLNFEFDEFNFSASLFLIASREYKKDMQFWFLYMELHCWKEDWLHLATDKMHQIWQYSINGHKYFLDQGLTSAEIRSVGKALYHELESDYYTNYQSVDKM